MSAVTNWRPVLGQAELAVADGDEAEHDGGVDERQQVVDLEGEFVGKFGEVDRAAVGVDDLDEAGRGRRRWRREAGRSAGGLVSGGRRSRRRLLAAGEQAVELIDERLEAGSASVARAGEVDGDLGLEDRPGLVPSTRTRSASRTASSMLWVTMQIALVGNSSVGPQVHQLGAQVLRGQHVEGAERLVHQQGVGFDDQRAGEPDPLAHAAGEFLGVGGSRSRPGRSGRSRRGPAGAAARRGIAWACRPSSTLSWTVSHGISAKDWKTIAVAGVGAGELGARGSGRCPRRAAISPAMMRSSVDLPDPDLPSRATISPVRRCRSIVVEDVQFIAVGAGEGLADVLRRR